MDQGRRILECLQRSLESNPEVIKAAEAQLQQESQQPGYGVVLTHIALASTEVAPHLRQLAAVLLKQYVKQHWVEGERGFQHPEASEVDKAQIRAALPAGLSDPNSKIRTAVGVAIAAIANWDWPQAWPGLLESIVSSIKEQKEPNLLMGCLKCLSVMASDLDNESAPQLMQALSPELAALVSNPATSKSLAATCYNIMAELANSLGMLSGTYRRQVRNMLVPLMPPWVQLVCATLSSDMKVREDWPAKLAALKLSQPLVNYFSKPLEPVMPGLMGATWQLLLAAQPLHQAVLVEGQAEDGAPAGDGEDDEEELSLETLLAQLFELLLGFVGPARFRRQLEAALPQMMFEAIAYMQMTQVQAETWASSAGQLIADEEEDMYSCRASADLLLTELSEQFGAAALAALLEGVSRRLAEADAAAAASQPAWWQLREAALSAVGSCSESIVEAVSTNQLPAAQVQSLLDTLLLRDLQPLHALQQQQQPLQLGDEGRQFLLGRALRVCSQLHEAATPQQRGAMLQAAATAVTHCSSSPVQVNAFRALAAVCPYTPPEQLSPQLPALLAALVQQLGTSDEESLHLVLEVLEAVLRAAGRAPGGLQPEQAMAVAQPVLQAWVAHTSDPLIGPDAQDVIATIAKQPACLPSLAAAAAPTLAGIISRGAAAQLARRQGGPAAAAAAAEEAEGGPMLVEASLDLLGTMVDPQQPAVALELARGVLGPVLGLIQASDDPSQLKSAVTLLLQLLRVCPTSDLLSIDTCFTPAGASSGSGGASGGGGTADRLLLHLLTASRQLLAPTQPDSCTGVAGPLLSQLVKTFPAQLAAAAPAGLAGPGAASTSCVGLLLRDVASKLASGTCSPATVSGLLQLVVRLALLDVGQLVELLGAMQLQPAVAQEGAAAAGGSVSGLQVVLPLWLEHACDLSGALLTRQCAAALLQLLQLRHHPALAGLLVAGQPAEEAGGAGGRVTRSRAKQQGGLRYTQVPAPAKVLQVLGQLLAADEEGAREGRAGLGEPHSEDEETDSDAEEDEEAGAGGGGAGAGGGGRFGNPMRQLEATGIRLSTDDVDILDVLNRAAASSTLLPEDPADAADPLVRLSVRALLRQGLGALAQSDPGFMAAAAGQLGPGRELSALQALLAAPAGAAGAE